MLILNYYTLHMLNSSYKSHLNRKITQQLLNFLLFCYFNKASLFPYLAKPSNVQFLRMNDNKMFPLQMRFKLAVSVLVLIFAKAGTS